MTRKTRRVLWVVLVASLLGPSLPSAAQTQGKPASPARIISLIPAVTEMLFAIGAGDRIVAVSSFDSYPPEVQQLQRVGALLDPDLEKILGLRPDLVVVYGTQSDLRRQLERAGIPQYVYSHGSLGDIASTIRQLGQRIGRPAEADRAANSIEGGIAAIQRRVAGRAKPRTLLIVGREAGALRGIFASGGVGFLNDMLEAAGATNIFEDVQRQSVQATSELILARRPDVILELRGTPVTADEAQRERAVWNVVSSVPAVRSGRVHIIADERTVIPGPRVVEGTELLARALHPDAFQ